MPTVETGTAVFEFFFRRLPDRRGFLLAAGLEQALDFLENLRFPPTISIGSNERALQRAALDYLGAFRFTGDVHAMPEGTVCFGNEPILRVAAPLPQAQLVETRLINILHYESLIASKAARMVLAAAGKAARRFRLASRPWRARPGCCAARASYLAGFAGTATVVAERQFGIPTFGTMAHSFIEAHDDEATAFEQFARARPGT